MHGDEAACNELRALGDRSAKLSTRSCYPRALLRAVAPRHETRSTRAPAFMSDCRIPCPYARTAFVALIVVLAVVASVASGRAS
jgi:hypothetical protein